MTVKKRAFVFLDYDMLIRHFVLSGALKELEIRYEVTYVIHTDSTSPKKGIYADIGKLKLDRKVLFEVPRKRMGSWDKLYQITALAKQRGTKNYAYRRRQIANVRGWARTRYYEVLSLPGIFPFVRRKLLAELGVYQPLQEFLARERPDIVVHPSLLAGYFVNELNQICPKIGIPIVLLMNSWDNPSAKAMNSGIPDRLVVWGPQTRQHAVDFLKIPPDRIVEFGAAQFDVYREPVTESDAELRRMFGVPERAPVILYAGVSKSVNETVPLLELDAAITAGRLPPVHVLYRPHPWRGRLVEGEQSFFDTKFRHVTMDPFMADYYRRAVADQAPGFDLADYKVTARLLRMVSGVISPLSTILLEACMHGLPVIMFYPDGNRDYAGRYISLSRKLPHFSEFLGPKGIQVVTDPAQLNDACKRMLSDSQNPAVRSGLLAHAKNYVVMDGPRYGERLADLADELTRVPRSQAGARAVLSK